MPRRKTQETIISEFKIAHGDYYSYSKVEYKNSNTKVIVVCPSHGDFLIAPGHHKNGVGCRKCYFESQKITKTEFIRRSQEHFGNRYSYSLISESSIDGKSKVKIQCLEHDVIFLQELRNHIRGHTGCPKCRSNILSGNQDKRGIPKSQEELNHDFIRQAIEVHGDKYDYENFQYVKSSTPGKIICNNHGEFMQAPSNHLRGSQCPACVREKQKQGTFKQLCKEKGINYYRALKRRKAGLPDEKIFSESYIRNERTINEIKVFGEKYPNLEEAVRVLKPPASSTTISRWVDEGLSPEEAFERIPNPGYADGIIYLITNNINQKKYISLTTQTLQRRWKYHIEQANAGHIKSEASLHAAIRNHGKGHFHIEEIDRGITKKDLEAKERKWIKELNTLTPNGYNLSAGGVSGGSHKKPTVIDGIRFESVGIAAEYLSKLKGITLAAAKKRISTVNIHAKKPAEAGKSIVKTKIYKAWRNIFDNALNPKSRNYVPNIEVTESWKNFDDFRRDVGEPLNDNVVFARLDKMKGYFPENCAWLSKSEAGKINAKYMKENGLLVGRGQSKRV